MLTSFTLGAQVDIATGKEVQEAADRVIDGVEGLFARVSKRPVYVTRAQSLTVAGGATTTVTLNLGSPPHNRTWLVQRVMLQIIESGTGQVSIPADAFASLYVGSADDPASFRGYVDRNVGVLDPSTPIPVLGNDAVYLVVEVQTGFQADAQMYATALYAEMIDQAVLRGTL